MIITRKRSRLVKPELYGTMPNCVNFVALAPTDLIMPMVHVDILFAFGSPAPPVQELEDGLAKVLCEYREWAGRIGHDDNGWETIELSDEGVLCVEATADCSVEDLLRFYPNAEHLHDLLPQAEGTTDPLLVQMTKFRCGGLTLGMAWNHRVADGQAFVFFMKQWTLCVRGLPLTCTISHDRSPLMMTTRGTKSPTCHIPQIREIKPHAPATLHNSVSKTRLHFTPTMLQKMQNYESPTAVTSAFAAVTGHLWKCVTQARRLDADVISCLVISIDARPRLRPPLPESYFGNAVFAPLTVSTARDLFEKPEGYSASLIQSSLAQINDDYLREALVSIQESVERLDQDTQLAFAAYPNLVVSSWLNFPLYEMDFGWGAPTFVGNVPRGEEGIVVLLPSDTRDGSVDAVVQLFTDDLQRLEELCYLI